MNKNDYIIRLKKKEDYREVENLVRAFSHSLHDYSFLARLRHFRTTKKPVEVPEYRV